MTISAALDSLRRQIAPDAPAEQVPALPSLGWSDRLQRETLEPVPNHPDQWQEPEASAALCCWCSDPLAEGDLLSCVEHQQTVGVTAKPDRSGRAVTLGPSSAGLSVTPGASTAAVAVTSAPAIGRHDLLALAGLRGWEALAFKPGESAGGTEPMWRTFAETACGEILRLALAAVWERWRDTVAQYSQEGAPVAPGAREAA